MNADTAVPRCYIVGLNQTKKAIRAGSTSKVYLADDADTRVREQVLSLCRETGTDVVAGSTMEQLGCMCGIDVGCAVCAAKS